MAGSPIVSRMTYDNGVVLEPTTQQEKSENTSIRFMMDRVLEIFGTSGLASSLHDLRAFQCSKKVLITVFQRMLVWLVALTTVS